MDEKVIGREVPIDPAKPVICDWCGEQMRSGDLVHLLVPFMHHACTVRAIMGSIGHLEGKCACFVAGSTDDDPPGISKRAAAELVVKWIDNLRRPQQGEN